MINKVMRTKIVNGIELNDTNVYTVNNLKRYIAEDTKIVCKPSDLKSPG